MQYFKEESKQIPIIGSYDVIVAGGGPAGIGAAYGAAKNGAKTLLVETSNCLGGMAIPGMMSHWVGECGSSVYHEILNRSQAENWDCEELNPENRHVINQEKQKLIILEILEEVGVEIQLRTAVADVIKEGKTIKGVITESKSGREVILSKVVIDCTGDGDVAALAGAEFTKGRESDNRMQPVTLMFKIAGVDDSQAVYPGSFETLVDTPKGELQALARKILPGDAGHVLVYRTTIPGIVIVNMTNVIDIDGTNARDLSRAEIICAKQIPEIVKFLREYVPGYSKCFAISSASNVGVRETRHFKCHYKINENDIIEGKTFEDWIATRCVFNFDIHNVDGAGLDKDGAQKNFHSKGSYTIPYRSCLPFDFEGLLLAGRCIDGTHKAHANFRAMPICTGIGQGCGTAAALAVKTNTLLSKIDVSTVQKMLLNDGVIL